MRGVNRTEKERQGTFELKRWSRATRNVMKEVTQWTGDSSSKYRQGSMFKTVFKCARLATIP